MKNYILKISGVSFSKCLHFWPACWGFGGFPGNFKHFNEHMQKESPRGNRNDHFGYGAKLNIEITTMMKMMVFSDYNFEAIFEAGVPQGSSKSIPGIRK